MTQQYIQVGTAPNDGNGDPIRTAFIKTNDNFSELYARVQVSPPSSAIGKIGDEIGYYAPTADYFYYCFANYNGSNIIWAQIQSAGNIAATKIQNGNSLIEILDTNGNANVADFLPVYSGNISAEYISVTGNINSNNILNSASISAQGNILTQSTVSALGNIVTSGYFVGGVMKR